MLKEIKGKELQEMIDNQEICIRCGMDRKVIRRDNSDCVVYGRSFCPFGCYFLFNKDVDEIEIWESFKEYSEKCSPSCAFRCPVTPAQDDVKCENNKCVIARYAELLTKQQKCENSGGHWINPCETGQCYQCDCYLSHSGSPRFKILREDECVSCKEDKDCGINFCSMSRNACREEKYFCENEKGLCRFEVEWYGTRQGSKTHECINGECVVCGDGCITK